MMKSPVANRFLSVICRSATATLALVLSLVLVLVPSVDANAQGVFYSTETVLTDFFSDSERVGFTRVQVGPHAAHFSEALGYVPSRAEFVVFEAFTGERLDGYAVIDNQKGQHQPITFAIKVGPSGVVERVEVMVYREGYGDEIREPRFREQFVGLGSSDPIRFGQDIVAITGATISSKAFSIAVKRAVAVVELVRRQKKVELGSSSGLARSR